MLDGLWAAKTVNHAIAAVSPDGGERLASMAKPKAGPLKLKPTKADKQGVANAFERHG